jgi:hypothetical protein
LNQVIQVLSAWQTDFFNESTRTNTPKLKVLEAAIAELREEIDKLKGGRDDQDTRLQNAGLAKEKVRKVISAGR